MKRWRIAQALALLGAYIIGSLENRREWKSIWRSGFVFCSVSGCYSVGQYAAGKHRACRNHADELIDVLLSGCGDAIDRLNKREKDGEFLPYAEVRPGVFKSKGKMGPMDPKGLI